MIRIGITLGEPELFRTIAARRAEGKRRTGGSTMATAVRTIAPELVGTWDIDNAHSNVEAVARYAMLSNVRGRFNTFSGTITVGETLADSRVEVEIESASIDTSNEKRD